MKTNRKRKEIGRRGEVHRRDVLKEFLLSISVRELSGVVVWRSQMDIVIIDIHFHMLLLIAYMRIITDIHFFKFQLPISLIV